MEKGKVDNLVNKQRFFRRLVLVWAMVLITHFVIFLMDHKFLIEIGAAGATVVTSVIGILTTVIGFYQWHRSKEDGATHDETPQNTSSYDDQQ